MRCSAFRRLCLLPLLSGIALLACVAAPHAQEAGNGEATEAQCWDALAAARVAADARPADSGTRLMAMSLITTAITEANNSEFDECLAWAEKARTEAVENLHPVKAADMLRPLPDRPTPLAVETTGPSVAGPTPVTTQVE